MKNQKCPKCKATAEATSTTCLFCGCPLESNQPKPRKRLLIAVTFLLIIIAACIAFFYFRISLPLKQSQQAFEQANVYESELDYERAIHYYSMVIVEDEQNYTTARNKITDLTERIAINKSVACYYVALENVGIASSVFELKNIKISKLTGIMTCQIDGQNYSVSTVTDFLVFDETSGLYSKKYDQTTNKFVVKYAPTDVYYSWLASSQQLASDMLFDTVTTSAKYNSNTNLDLVQHYVDLYKEYDDITILTE